MVPPWNPCRGKIYLKFSKESTAEGLRMSGTYPVYKPDFTNGHLDWRNCIDRNAHLRERARKRTCATSIARVTQATWTINIFALLLGVRHKASPSPVHATRFFLFLLLKVVYSARPRGVPFLFDFLRTSSSCISHLNSMSDWWRRFSSWFRFAARTWYASRGVAIGRNRKFYMPRWCLPMTLFSYLSLSSTKLPITVNTKFSSKHVFLISFNS